MALGSISNLYPNGRPSGLPDDIVDQLVQAKQQQELTPIKKDIEETKELKDSYSGLNSNLVDIYKATDTLNSQDSFSPSQASSSNESVATVDAGANAQTGSYSLSVTQLAQAHTQVVGVDDNDANTGVTQGIGDAQDSTQINDGVTVSFYHQGTEYSYTTDADSTLESLANTIDNDDNGVNANPQNIGTSDNPQYVLSLKSEQSGNGQNQITTDEAGTSEGISLSSSLFADSGGNVLATEQETAQDGLNSEFDVDGISYTRSSNEITDVIDNSTINLSSKGDTDITISRDTEKITENVQKFVDAYNSFQQFLDNKASYNQEEDEAGPLMGSSLARSSDNKLSSLVSQPISGSTKEYLFQAGIEKNSDGTLAFDQAKFKEQLQEDPDGTRDLFVGDGSVMDRIGSFLKEHTNEYGGAVPSKIDTVSSRIDDLKDDYSETQQEIVEYREDQTEKFGRLENLVLKYQKQSDQLSSYLDTSS